MLQKEGIIISQFIKIPHLPINRVEELIIGEKYVEKLSRGLSKFNITPIIMPPNPCVSVPLASHADLSVLHLGGNRFIIAKDAFSQSGSFVNYLTNRGAEVFFSEAKITPAYPQEADLNACIIGDRVICNRHTVDLAVLSGFSDSGIIHVRQGYTKCSICVVDENSIITTDHGIAKACTAAGLQVLELASCDVSLEGYDKGFIGGAAFKLSRDILAFTGVIKEKHNEELIHSFLAKRGIKTHYLTAEPVFDIGSAIPFSEQY